MTRNMKRFAALAAALWLVACGGEDDDKGGDDGNAGGAAGSDSTGDAGTGTSGAAGSDTGAGGRGAAGSDTGAGGSGDTGEPDEACLAESDPDAPVLRLRAVIPTEPEPLADIAANSQSAVDDGSLNYLLSMSDLSSGSSSGLFGVGESTDSDDTYRYTGEPAEMTFVLAGESFVSQGAREIQLIVPLPLAGDLSIPLQEPILSGEFNTGERCSIGEQIEEGPPSEWETSAEMTGLLAIDDAREITLTLANRSFTLCSYLAYGSTGVLQDPDCAADASEWPYPPDETSDSGDDAWRVTAEFAATAVYLE